MKQKVLDARKKHDEKSAQFSVLFLHLLRQDSIVMKSLHRTIALFLLFTFLKVYCLALQ